ncbi:MAG: peptidylprolyl isomerase [Verrucomicrobiae bacterium]|nr:peptidylprolyl isomerase [Verrucomicrobiae bacterium]MDW8309879.1 peptidylprolyl isomerase [Verrucomicrobiales bacterium]
MKPLRGLVMLLGGACASAWGQGQLVDGIKAVVHDAVITHFEVEAASAPALEQLRRQYRNEPETYQQRAYRLLDENLEQLIERQLILRDFEASGYSLPEVYFENAIEEEIQRAGGRSKLLQTLRAQGLTFEKFRRQIREQIILRALRGKHVTREVIISPHKIERYYQANQDKYRVEDQVKLRMIVLNKPGGAGDGGASNEQDTAVRRMAEEIRRKILEGAAFSEMASIYSQGAQRQEGGDWGWVERKVLRAELREAAFALPVGQVSEVIETPEACYLMLVEQRRAAHVRPLVEVQEEIERALLAEEHARLQKQYVERLRKKTFVRYF